MARIRLKSPYKDYFYDGQRYMAGRIYEVSNDVAHYLCCEENIAEPSDGEPIAISGQKRQSIIYPANDNRIKIAVIRLGGIGDTLMAKKIAMAIKRRYPDSEITIFIRDTLGKELVEGQAGVDKICMAGTIPWDFLLSRLRDKGLYDIIYDNKYITKVFYSDPVKFKEDKEKTDKAFAPFSVLYQDFPFSNNELTKVFTGTERQLSLQTADLIGEDSDMEISLQGADSAMLPLLEGKKYVTIHNASDVSRKTKAWYLDGWKDTVNYLIEDGYKVIQIGLKFEDVIPGAIDMTGKLSIKQTAGILSKASFHIDTESGLVHLARSVNTRSIVFFFCTPKSFFGYPSNINIETKGSCKNKFWMTELWWRNCVKDYQYPYPCTLGIDFDMVKNAVIEVEIMPPIKAEITPVTEIISGNDWDHISHDKEDLNEKFAKEMQLDEDHYKSEPWQWDRIYTMMEQVKGPKVLEIGAGDGYCMMILKARGFDVTGIEISKIRLERCKRGGHNVIEGDINALPFPDACFDSVIAGEVLEHVPSMAKALSELERVCKPDGKIIVSLPIADIFRSIKMHLWGISHQMVKRNGKDDMIVLTFDRINRE